MKIHEYQAKAILAEFGVPVPRGEVASTAEEAKNIAFQLGGKVVIKAQVHAGGRGKAGGIKVASSPEEAAEIARQMIGSRLVTHQTTAEGVPIEKVLIEEAIDVKRELYLGITIDRASSLPAIMASEAGGMEIEEIAHKHPEKILKLPIQLTGQVRPYHLVRLVKFMGWEKEMGSLGKKIAALLAKAFI